MAYGSFVLTVASARKVAEQGGVGRVIFGSCDVYVTRDDDGRYVVEPAGLWPDLEWIDRVQRLLDAHG